MPPWPTGTLLTLESSKLGIMLGELQTSVQFIPGLVHEGVTDAWITWFFGDDFRWYFILAGFLDCMWILSFCLGHRIRSAHPRTPSLTWQSHYFEYYFRSLLQNHVFLRRPLHLGRARRRKAWPKWRGRRPNWQSQVIGNPLLKCVPLLNCYRFLSWEPCSLYSFWKKWYWSFFRHVLLPERAASVACGGNHTVALTQSGESKTIFLVQWSELLWYLPSLQMSNIALHVPLLSNFRQIVHVWPLNQRAAWPGKPHPWVFHSPPCRLSFLA